MKLKLITWLILSNFCTQIQAATIATVNGVEISSEELDALKKQTQSRLGRTLSSKELTNTLVRTEVVRQEAEKAGLANDPKVLKQLKEIKKQIIISRYMEKISEEVEVTEADYKMVYKKFLQDFPRYQYKASHILVKTEAEAKEIISSLKKGADFAKLAKEKSTGPSGVKGGSLGWFDKKTMVKEFSNAVILLSKGKFTESPVKTRFGYHVILLVDKKDNKAPGLDQLKPEFDKELRPQKIMSKIEDLTAKAKVEFIDNADSAANADSNTIGASNKSTQAAENKTTTEVKEKSWFEKIKFW